MELTRRALLRRSLATGAGIAVAGGVRPFGLLDVASAKSGTTPLGPMLPDPAGILDLPADFRYTIVTRSGRPLAGQASGNVPGSPDGTGSFRAAKDEGTLLVNNHELIVGSSMP